MSPDEDGGGIERIRPAGPPDLSMPLPEAPSGTPVGEVVAGETPGTAVSERTDAPTEVNNVPAAQVPEQAVTTGSQLPDPSAPVPFVTAPEDPAVAAVFDAVTVISDSVTATKPDDLITQLKAQVAECDRQEKAIMTIELEKALEGVRAKKALLLDAIQMVEEDPEVKKVLAVLVDIRARQL